MSIMIISDHDPFLAFLESLVQYLIGPELMMSMPTATGY